MKKLLIILSLPLLCQCQSIFNANKVTQQGNYLSSAKVNQLKIGMTKQQVETLLGTSLIADTFDNERMDYAFTYQKGNNPRKVKHLSLSFSHNQLSQIDK